MRRFLIVLFIVMISYVSFISLAQSMPQIINSVTIADLEQVYTFSGDCVAFHPDASFMITTHGVFNLDTGEQMINVSDDSVRLPTFSPDGSWLIIESNVIDVQTWDVVHEFEAPQRQHFRFSDDSRFAHSNGSTFSLPDWNAIETDTVSNFEFFRSVNYIGLSSDLNTIVGFDLKIGNGIPRYLSSGESYWVVVTGGLSDAVEQGVYDVGTGELLSLPSEFDDPFDAALLLEMSVITPNDAILITSANDEGIYTAYRLPSFEQAYELTFDIGDENRIFVPFSENSLYFGVEDDGIYQSYTGERLFEINGQPLFDNNNVWVGTGDGVYTLPTGRQIETFSDGAEVTAFSADDELVAVVPDGVFDLLNGGNRFDVTDNVYDMFFSSDSSLLYALTTDRTTIIYETATGSIQQTVPTSEIILSLEEHFIAGNIDSECIVYSVQ